jgi:hypothetical protein
MPEGVQRKLKVEAYYNYIISEQKAKIIIEQDFDHERL